MNIYPARSIRSALLAARFTWLAAVLSAFLLPSFPALSSAAAPPDRALVPVLVPQLGHEGWVNAVALSSDGRLAATASSDGTAILWDVESGAEIRRFRGHFHEVTAVAFSPDGRSLLTGSDDQTARLWNVRTGKEQLRLPHELPVTFVAFFPDGTRLLTGERNGRASLWSAVYGTQMRTFSFDLFADPGDYGRNASVQGNRRLGRTVENAAHLVALSPDGKTVATVSRLWDAGAGALIHEFPGRIGAVFFTPDGQRVVTAEDGVARIWSRVLGMELRADRLSRLSHLRETAVAFAPGNRVASSEGGTIWLDDLATGEMIARLDDGGSLIVSLAFSADGSRLLAGRSDGRATLWDMTRASVLHDLGGLSSGASSSVAASPDGRWILVGSQDGAARLWGLSRGGVVREVRHDGPVTSVTFSRDGSRFATGSGDHTARLLEVSSGQEVLRTQAKVGVNVVAISPEGRFLFVGSGKRIFGGAGLLGTIGQSDHAQLWDAATGSEVWQNIFDGPLDVEVAAFSADGLGILTSGVITELKDVQSGPARALIRDRALAAVFSPDERLIATGCSAGTVSALGSQYEPCSVWTWDVATAKQVRAFSAPLGGVLRLAFSPDGRWLAGAAQDGTVPVWETATGSEVVSLTGHTAGVNSVAFLPDGRHLLTGSDDGTSRLWSLPDGRELCRLLSFPGGNWLVVSPDGRFDGNRLETTLGIHWVLPDAPLSPLAPEIFLRDYYEPRLLPRLLAGEQLPPVRSLADLNRAQPEVRITRVEPVSGSTVEVTVEVEVASRQAEVQREGKPILQESGVYDLRLFRDGQVVAVTPDDTATSGEVRSAEALLRWREIHRIPLDGNGHARRSFVVRLPRRAGGEVTFTAYAFNSDRVKSATALRSVKVARDQPAARGRAYVLTVGVAGNENPAWRLSYPANDARALRTALSGTLRRAGRYREVIEVSLVSGRTEGDHGPEEILPTKNNLRTVLDILAGRKPGPDRWAALPEPLRSRLAPASPEDLVVISWSGHGSTDPAGIFRLYPHDLGTDTEVPTARTISSEELALWLRGVDAGEMALVLDACRSGAAAGPGFRPGPLGDSGLGQLAYDKGMLILAATQADNDAIGSGSLRHGLLSFALAREGLEEGRAVPAGELFSLRAWLRYGRDRVPALFQEKVALVRPEARVQEPLMFDFVEPE